METAIRVLLILGLVPIGAFIYRYWKGGAWNQTYQGITLMTQKIAWFFLLLHFLAESLFEYPAHDIVEIVIVSLCVLLFWATLAGLLLAQGSLEWFFALVRKIGGRIPKPFRKVSRKRGTGYVMDKDIERTQDRRKPL